MMKGSFEVQSVEETWRLAAELARELKPGDVLCLEGELGAGKTTFTQGLAHALGVPGRVTSPTFCIVQEHAGERTLLVHMDLYRLHGEDDVLAIGWEDYLLRGGVCAVEWSENVSDAMEDAITVRIEKASEEERIITIEGGVGLEDLEF